MSFSRLPLERVVDVLLGLDDASLGRACQTDTYVNSICQDDWFWRLKVERRFGGEVIQYKPSNETFFQQYQYLLRTSDPNVESERGRLDALIVLERRGVLPGVIGANWAAAKGHLQILEWLDQRGVRPSVLGANLTADNGHLQVLEWLERRGVLPGVLGANWAADNGHAQVSNWLAQRGIYSIR